MVIFALAEMLPTSAILLLSMLYAVLCVGQIGFFQALLFLLVPARDKQ